MYRCWIQPCPCAFTKPRACSQQVNRLSGLELDAATLAEATQDPLLQAVHRLAREFGWTLDEISALSVGQILLQLEMLRGDGPDVEAGA